MQKKVLIIHIASWQLVTTSAPKRFTSPFWNLSIDSSTASCAEYNPTHLAKNFCLHLFFWFICAWCKIFPSSFWGAQNSWRKSTNCQTLFALHWHLHKLHQSQAGFNSDVALLKSMWKSYGGQNCLFYQRRESSAESSLLFDNIICLCITIMIMVILKDIKTFIILLLMKPFFCLCIAPFIPFYPRIVNPIQMYAIFWVNFDKIKEVFPH